MAEARTRSIRITNLPPATQEGLLQQMLEKIVPVSRVEVFIDKQEAIVELKTPAVSPCRLTMLCKIQIDHLLFSNRMQDGCC